MNANTSNDNTTVAVEQAVFTSIRSPMGEGYRIVATSPGVRPDERAEITRRSPSHGSLGAADGATLAYPLASGRFCVAFCCAAGKEHTARGGERVYTHYAVLTPEAYAAFGFDPFRVRAALRAAIGDALVLKQTPSLPGLQLKAAYCRPDGFDGAVCVEFLMNVGIAALGGGSAVVSQGADSAFRSAAVFFAALPAAARKSVSVSVGLKFALSRQLRFCFVESDNGETQRALRGQSIQWLDFSKGVPSVEGASGELAAWFKFALQRISAGRDDELASMTSEMADDAPPELLGRSAALCQDYDAIATADAETLMRLGIRWNSMNSSSGVLSRLLGSFRKAWSERDAAMRAAAECEAAVVSG